MSIKAHVANLTIHIGPSSTQGRLLSIQAPVSHGRGAGSYRLCTPEGVPVKQVYVDPETLKPYVKDELKHFVEGNLKEDEPEVKKIFTDKEWGAIEEAKVTDLPKNAVTLSVHPATANDQLWPTSKNNSYLFVPDDNDPRNIDVNDVIRSILNSGDYVLVTNANIRNHEGFYRLTLWRGQVAFEPMVYTDALNAHEVESLEGVDKTLAKVSLKVAGRLVEDFDAGDYVDNKLIRVKAIEAGKAGDKIAGKIAKAKRDQDVRSELVQFLENA